MWRIFLHVGQRWICYTGIRDRRVYFPRGWGTVHGRFRLHQRRLPKLLLQLARRINAVVCIMLQWNGCVHCLRR